MFDTVCKFLVETFSADFATWLLGQPMALSELSPTELSLEPIRADALILLQAEDTILHLEFQSRPDLDMAFRMVDYRLRVYRRFPQKAMRQVVIYLRPSQAEGVYQTAFEIPGTRHEFEVIRLWEQSPASFLDRPGLLPFAVLTQTSDRPALLRQVAEQIEQLPDRREQSNVAASTAILAGLLLEKDVIRQILKQETMQESVIYQEIKAEGRQEGLQEGRQEGRRQEALAMVLRLLGRRLGPLPEAIQAQIMPLSISQVEALGENLFDFTGLSDLETWLAQLQDALAQTLAQLTQELGKLPDDAATAIQALAPELLTQLDADMPQLASLDALTAWLQTHLPAAELPLHPLQYPHT